MDTASSFWRRFLDLRTSPEDNSQRMLNALEPGTMVPIHRHMGSTEVVVLLRGRAIQYYYNDEGEVIDQMLLEASGSCSMMSVEVGQWHRLEALESGTVIFEAKDGAYEPMREEEVREGKG